MKLLNITHDMSEKEFGNFLTRSYSNLWLLKGYVYPTLKKYGLVNLELVEDQTGQVFVRFFGAVNKRRRLF